jgi:phosphatidylglycerol:prolipoprotein diacylglycerol transferase
MNRTLFHVGGFGAGSYSVLLTLSFVIGAWLAAERGARRGIKRTAIVDVALISFAAAIVGSRLLHLWLNPDPQRTWADVLALSQGGLAMYGGVLLAMAASWLYLRWRQIAFLRVADAVAPSLALGLALTRIGCFLNGCCFGWPTALPWGVSFPPECAAYVAFGGAALHPTQLYSSVWGLAMAALLLAAERSFATPGRLFGLFLVMDASGRILLDLVRAHEPGAYLASGVTVHQAICAGLFVLGAYLLSVPLKDHLRRHHDQHAV